MWLKLQWRRGKLHGKTSKARKEIVKEKNMEAYKEQNRCIYQNKKEGNERFDIYMWKCE